MGQASSRGTSDSRARSRARPSSWAPALDPRPRLPLFDDQGVPELLSPPQTSSSSSSRFRPFHPFHRLPGLSERPDAGSSGSSGSSATDAAAAANLTRRPSRISRYRDSLTSIPSVFSRRTSSTSRDSSLPFASPSRSSHRHSSSAPYNPSTFFPRVHAPDMALNFDDLPDNSDSDSNRPPPLAPRLLPMRSHGRSASVIPSFRPDRGIRSMTSSLRRRRSPLRADEDQAVVLSRLLSYAAAATAASLMGDDHRAASEARGADGEDGTFDSFLQALQNGRIASALRENGSETEDAPETPGGNPLPLNFFRMFRFGSAASNRRNDGTSRSASGPGGNDSSGTQAGEEEGDGRMVPIIIVGIRSINPGSNSGQDDNIPPFLDALSSFPTPMGSPNDDNLLPRPPNTTRFSHRRRASMGGLNSFPSSYDSPRHYRAPDRPRPWSTLTDSPSGPMPPPSTPASSGLSAVSSGTTTPTFSTSPPSPTVQSSAPSRRGSFIRRATGTNLEPTVEEPNTPQRTPRQRRLSESDFTRYGSGASRRNGVVEPDHNPGEGSRSWIIYVLGGSYPENHPILTTPSLFTDSPTYEDMLLLSSLLGPAKPPVASEEDVASAPGLLVISWQPAGNGALVAESVDGSGEVVKLAPDARCLVCLSDFEIGEAARKLVKCEHMFHRECIDQWLTTGRNSCPLCRGEGVEEKTADTSEQTPHPGVTHAPGSQAVG